MKIQLHQKKNYGFLLNKLAFIFILCLTQVVVAQSPGGVSGGGTMQIWLDATQLNLANNAQVSSFTDFSGNGNHATSSSIYRPRFNTADAAFNNKPSLTFDGADDNMLTGAISALNTNTLSSYVVFKTNSNVGSVIFRSAYTSGAASGNAYMFGTILVKSKYEYQAKKLDGSHVKFLQNYTANTQFAANVWDGTNSFNAYVNGTSLGTTITDGSATPGGHLGIALGKNYSGPASYYNGKIAELFVYSKKINSAERNILDNYMSAKYNMSIPNDMYAFQASHSYDLIGLGAEADGSNLNAKGYSNLTLSTNSLGAGSYVFAAHNNAGYSSNIVDVPASIVGRYNQVWRADLAGSPGAVDLSFDVSANPLGLEDGYILLLDNDGVFATGSTEISGVYNNGVVTFTGVTLASGMFFTLANNNVIILSTGNTTDWHLTTTWDCNCVPTSAFKVTIQNGHTVNINSQNAYCADLTIDGTLNMNSADSLFLNIYFTNNGSFNAGIGTVSFTGTNPQLISGTNTFYNLHVNNVSGVTNTGTINMKNWLHVLTGSSFATGNNVRLLSSSTGTAAIKNPALGTISGSLTLERYLNEGDAWYLLAPSLVGGTLADWNNEFEMSGFTGTDIPAYWPSVYYYNQSNNVSSMYDGYSVPNSTFDVIANNVGWEIYIGNDSKGTMPRTIDMTGSLALGNINFSAPHLANIGDISEDGWTLMANPYASPIQWRDVARSGSFDKAYYKKADGTSVVMGFNFVLAPGEAFWVHSDPGGSTIQFETSGVCVTNTDNYNLRQEANTNLIVELHHSTGVDVTEIGFGEEYKNIRERGVDAYKLYNSDKTKPNLSTLMDGEKFLVNLLNSDEDMVLPLLVDVVQPKNMMRTYTLNFKNVVSNVTNRVIHLENIETNQLVELTEGYAVTFEMNDADRTPKYQLVIKNNKQHNNVIQHTDDSYVAYTTNGVNIHFNNQEEKNIKLVVYDGLGKIVVDENTLIPAYGKYSINHNLVNGLYFVQVLSNNNTITTHKIVIQQ
jgi:hypothetical protein